MTCIIIPEKNINLYANMNHRTSNPDKKKETGENVPYDWNDVREECKALQIPFMNQSFTGVGKMVQARFDVKGKKKHARMSFDKKDREAIWEDQGKKCACCSLVLGRNAFEVDHTTFDKSNFHSSLSTLYDLHERR